MLLWFLGMAIDIGPIPGIIVGILGCIYSIAQGFKDPHLHNIMLARQKFMHGTKGIIKTKGKTYVA